MVSASLLELFSVFCLLFSTALLMHIMVAEMAVFGSFQVKTLASGLVSEIIGSLHLRLSFLIDYPIFKNWVSKCSVLLCKI